MTGELKYTHNVAVFESHGLRNLYEHGIQSDRLMDCVMEVYRTIYIEYEDKSIGYIQLADSNGGWVANAGLHLWLRGEDEPELTSTNVPIVNDKFTWGLLIEKRIEKGPMPDLYKGFWRLRKSIMTEDEDLTDNALSKLLETEQ